MSALVSLIRTNQVVQLTCVESDIQITLTDHYLLRLKGLLLLLGERDHNCVWLAFRQILRFVWVALLCFLISHFL